MSNSAFAAILTSAVCHAAYNALVKTSRDKVVFYWSMYAVATAFILLLIPWTPRAYTVPQHPDILLFAFLSALFYTLYHLATGVAYSADGGDLSLSYPLSTTAPLYIPVLAYLLFGEIVSAQTLAGIVIVFAGACLIHLRPGGASSLFRLGHYNSRATRYALLAGFLYSFGAVADKQGVIASNFFVFTSFVIITMFLMLTATILVSRDRRSRRLKGMLAEPAAVIYGGILLFASFYLYRYGLATSDVSQAASIRQISALFAVGIGIRFLGEPYGRLRLTAAAVIVAGIILIKTG